MSDVDGVSREELLAALAERDAVIAVLRAEIEALKRRVGMDSSNSSMPPGSDGPATRAKRAKKGRKSSPRPRGGQAGHEGHGLQRVAVPDHVQVLAPSDCTGCGQSLAGVIGRIGSRIQVFDTPPVKLEVTEYRMLAVCCPRCRRTTRAVAPAGVAGPCCYGPNVRAATALFGLQRAYEHHPRRRFDGSAVGRAGVDRVRRRPGRSPGRPVGRLRGQAEAGAAGGAGHAS